MRNTAQTRSTEPHTGVLKHEKVELMDISSPQQDINDVDSVTVSSEKDTACRCKCCINDQYCMKQQSSMGAWLYQQRSQEMKVN